MPPSRQKKRTWRMQAKLQCCWYITFINCFCCCCCKLEMISIVNEDLQNPTSTALLTNEYSCKLWEETVTVCLARQILLQIFTTNDFKEIAQSITEVYSVYKMYVPGWYWEFQAAVCRCTQKSPVRIGNTSW